MPPGFFFCDYSQVLTSELFIEKHIQDLERDGLESLFGFPCPSQRVITFCLVSPV